MKLYKYVYNDSIENITAIKAAIILYQEFNEIVPMYYLIQEVMSLKENEEYCVHNIKIIKK